jgi:dihydropteroate synthase
MATASAARTGWRTARGLIAVDRPVIVGILNVTPDSFWGGGRHQTVDAALAHAEQLIGEGADVVDVGGESTRPGAQPVPAEEEARRVLPIVIDIARRWPDVPISIDTTKADVARAALDGGAWIVNDVSGLRLDAALAPVVASYRAGVVLMHSRGTVDRMASYDLAEYGPDPVREIVAELEHSVTRARTAGIDDASIVVDPGLGFAKRTAESVAVLAQLHRISALGFPVLVGPSRKRFVGELTGGTPPEDRLEGTIAACVTALCHGARLFRVHDAGAVRHALDVAHAIRSAM